MLISSKGQYALRLMVDISINSGSTVTVKAVARRCGLSDKYLSIFNLSDSFIPYFEPTAYKSLANVAFDEALDITEKAVTIITNMIAIDTNFFIFILH